MGKWIAVLLILALLFNAPGILTQAAKASGPYTQVYLPVIRNHSRGGTGDELILGVYTAGWLGLSKTIQDELDALGAWSEKHLTLAGIFMDIELPNYYTIVTKQLNLVWENGYTPFINIMTDHSAASLAEGDLDSALEQWASAFAEFAQDGQRVAFLSPLPEMNGDWTPYGRDPENFKMGFARIQRIFKEAGVADESMRWVFSPNGYSEGLGFEHYYPGDATVDVVGFSAYNFGYCPSVDWKEWDEADHAYGPFIDRMRQMAPSKPIFITQTGTTSYGPDGHNIDHTNKWLHDSYDYLAEQPGVRGVLYFNIGSDCDFRIFVKNSIGYDGYSEGVSNASYIYVAPGDILHEDF